MPRITSVKKKGAKKPSKNFFENRESVTYEDDVSVAEKSAELAKKIQEDKQKEIDDAVKKATKDSIQKTNSDSSLKKNVDDIIKKMVSEADRKQPIHNIFRNNSVTDSVTTDKKLRNNSITNIQTQNSDSTDKSVTSFVTNENKLRNNSVTNTQVQNVKSTDKYEADSVTELSTKDFLNSRTKSEGIDFSNINSSVDAPFAKGNTNVSEYDAATTNNSNTNLISDNSHSRNNSVTISTNKEKDKYNNSVTDSNAENKIFHNNYVTDETSNENKLHNSTVTNDASFVTNIVTTQNKLRNDPVTIRNNHVTDSVTKASDLRNSSVTNSITDNVTINKDFYSLVGVSKKIVFHIGELCYKAGSRITPPITFSELKAQLDISSNEVVRVNIHRLIKKDIFRKIEHKTGKGGYQILEVREHVYKELIEILNRSSVTNSVTEYSTLHNNSITDSVTNRVTNRPSSSISFNNINKKLTTNEYPFNPADAPGQQQLGPQFDSDWQMIDITPLATIGFTNNHLSQLFTKNELTPKQVQESINAFAFDLDENKRGEKIKTSPLNLFMGILKGGSPYNPPKNYESDEDRLLREQVEAEREKLEKRQQLQSELKDLKYQNWLLDLSIEKKLDILDVPQAFFEKMPIEAIQEGLKKHFEMKVL